jgi:tripartite-type tricarboxylate transporter receptor subunit TctC
VQTGKRRPGCALVLGAIFAVPPAAHAADYYAGKTIEIVVGAPPAGGFDIYARTIARHMPRHLPGAPNLVVKNMQGGGGSRAGIYISTIAPKDGTSIAAMMPGAIMDLLLEGTPVTQFDPTKVSYVGTADNGARTCVTFGTSRIKTFEDALTQRSSFGAGNAGNASRDYAYLHNKTLGTKFDIVSGYPGTNEIAIAMERGEIDGACGWGWSSFKSQRPTWLRDRKANVILQVGLQPNEELTRMGVPHIWKYVKGEENRKIIELIISQQAFQRPYIAPPGLASDVLAMLRKAFNETVSDPQFLAEAEKLHIDVVPLSGAAVQDIVTKLSATPKDIVEKARAAIRP